MTDLEKAVRETLRCRLLLRGASRVDICFQGDGLVSAAFLADADVWGRYLGEVGRFELKPKGEQGAVVLNGKFSHSRIGRDGRSDGKWNVAFSLEEDEELRLPNVPGFRGEDCRGTLFVGDGKGVDVPVAMPDPLWRSGEIRGGFEREEAEHVSYWIQCPPLPCKLEPVN